MVKKTHAKIGGINFVLQGVARSSREAFNKSFGSPNSYHKLKPTQLDRVWNSLQEVLIKEGYKETPKKEKAKTKKSKKKGN